MLAEKYFDRIGLERFGGVNYNSLCLILKRASQTVPFENLDVHLGRKIDLDKNRIVKKIIDLGRGGYCYEVNGLLFFVLKELGFDVSLMGARTIMGYREERPVTHMILKVRIDGICYLCDLGFTGMSSVIPLPFDGNGSFLSGGREISPNNYRLIYNEDTQFILQRKRGEETGESFSEEEWFSLYSFDKREMKLIDFELANFYNSRSEDSVCTKTLICSINTETGSVRLVDNFLKIREEGISHDTGIKNQTDLDGIFREYFNLSLTKSDVGKLFFKIKR